MSRLQAFASWWKHPGPVARVVRIALGLAIGGAVGYAYYSTVGCATGSCPITSNPWITTAWGAGVGGLLGLA